MYLSFWEFETTNQTEVLSSQRRCVFWHTDIYVLRCGKPPGSKNKLKSADSISHLFVNKKAKKATVSVSPAPSLSRSEACHSDTANSNTADSDAADSDPAHSASVEACTSAYEAPQPVRQLMNNQMVHLIQTDAMRKNMLWVFTEG